MTGTQIAIIIITLFLIAEYIDGQSAKRKRLKKEKEEWINNTKKQRNE